MAQDLKILEKQAKKAIQEAKTLQELDGVFRAYLGKKGKVSLILKTLPKLSKTKRISVGKIANGMKRTIQEVIEARTRELQATSYNLQASGWFDITLPSKKILAGHLHPLTLAQRQAESIFRSMGFGIAQGPEVENDWYNFAALNMPEDHPARDMWDTFWLKQENPKQKLFLRTHTSPVQIRYMETHEPPFRIIAPGRVFRYEATDAKHQINFYQLEGLMVAKEVSVAHFRAVIQEFFQRFFGKPVSIRLRPSYFPFTEPSFEVDMACTMCTNPKPKTQNPKITCSICGGGDWLEMAGAGMVHPNVFKAAGYIPKDWKGFAFGMGIDRLAMMKYKIDDIRLFYGDDLRFLQQF